MVRVRIMNLNLNSRSMMMTILLLLMLLIFLLLLLLLLWSVRLLRWNACDNVWNASLHENCDFWEMLLFSIVKFHPFIHLMDRIYRIHSKRIIEMWWKSDARTSMQLINALRGGATIMCETNVYQQWKCNSIFHCGIEMLSFFLSASLLFLTS